MADHSGSRGLGQAILTAHIAAHGHAALAVEAAAPPGQARVMGQAVSAYLQCHDAAVLFAEVNRAVIAARFFQRLHCAAVPVLDVNHNTVMPARIGGLDGLSQQACAHL